MGAKKETKTVKDVKKSLHMFADLTSFHGVKLFSVLLGPLRILWTVVLLLSVSFLCLMLYNRTTYFFSKPRQTNIRVDFNKELKFPAITICNLNKYRKSVVQKYPLPLAQFISTMKPDTFHEDHSDEVNWAEFRQELGKGFNFTKFEVEAAHNLPDEKGVFMCIWREKENCSDWFKEIYTDIGLCHQLVPYHPYTNQRLGIKRAGIENGITMTLTVEQDEYFFGIGTSAGYKVLIHNPAEEPFLEEGGFTIQPGSSVAAGMKFSILTRIPGVECRESQQVSNITYSACKSLCKYSYITKKCNCKMPILKDSPLKDCSLYKVATCVKRLVNLVQVKEVNSTDIEDTMDEHDKGTLEDINVQIGDCEAKCDPPCEEQTYEVALSYSRFPNEYDFPAYMERFNASESYIRNNFLQLKIFYETLNVMSMKQVLPYDGYAYLSDIGGALGLCFGASLLSLFEILHCFLFVCHSRYYKLDDPENIDYPQSVMVKVTPALDSKS